MRHQVFALVQAAATVLVLLTVAATPSGAAAASVPLSSPSASEATQPESPAPGPAAAVPALRAATLRFGAGTPGGPAASAELDEVAVLAGEAPSIVLSYKDFNQAPPLAELDAVHARGAVTLVTWEPWTWGFGTNQPKFSLDRIAAGDFDEYLRLWGTALAGWGHPVMLRFGHEMNGDWYPWSEGVNGNGSGDYAAAWRHVHDIVTSAGAHNITWVWNPNVPYGGSTPLDGLYPGSAYVEAVALDGYNWGTSAPWGGWTRPWQLFADGLGQLRSLAPGKQILIAETSSAEQGGSKAAWNAELVYYLASQPDITALVWFHFNKEADWRIDSSTPSATSLASALAARPQGPFGRIAEVLARSNLDGKRNRPGPYLLSPYQGRGQWGMTLKRVFLRTMSQIRPTTTVWTSRPCQVLVRSRPGTFPTARTKKTWTMNT